VDGGRVGRQHDHALRIDHDAAVRVAAEQLGMALLAAVRAEVAPTPDAPDRLLSISDTCAALGGVSRTTVYALFSSGALRSCRVGRRRLVPAGAITRYLRETANVSVHTGGTARQEAGR
jgi:excisionase family DNA binding protein